MSVSTPAELLSFLQEHGFLTLTQGQQLDGTTFADVRALARELISRNWLTPYQANQLLQGRGGELLLGPYRILDRLGEGGMGQVFKAYHDAMDRLVALKVIPKDRVANPTAVARFHREVRAVAKLSHPNIVTAFEVNQSGETPFLAMEYVEGIDLARLVHQSGPLPIARACEYVRQAATGLQHAHEKGLVHRDIKPGNLIVTRPGPDAPPLIKILDFGLARFESESDHAGRLTQLGKTLGTVDYIAPEQAHNARTADIRADIYSLGCTLFYLLTGKPPFPGEDVAERIGARVLGKVPSVRESRPEVSPVLELVLAKMMARNPAERYQTPGDVAKALKPHTEDKKKALLAAPTVLDMSVALAPPKPPAVAATAPTRTATAPLPKTEIVSVRKPREDEPEAPRLKTSVWLALVGMGVFGAVALVGVIVGGILYANSRNSAPTTGPALANKETNTDKPKPAEPSSKLYLSELNGFDWTGYGGLGKGCIFADEPGVKIAIKGVPHPLALGMHPKSSNGVGAHLKFLLRGLKAQSFTSSVAVNDTSDPPESPLTFVVLGDDKPLWTSKPVPTRHITQECNISVSGIDVLELRVNCARSISGAHGVWIDPFVTTGLTKTELQDYLKKKP